MQTIKNILISLVAILCISTGFAQVKVTTNLKNSSQPNGMLGWSVSLDGDYAAITAPNESYDDFLSGGAVYLYQKTNENWNFLERLAPDEPNTMMLFGLSVQIRNGLLAVGAPNDNGKSGSVYLYRLDQGTWKFAQKLLPAIPVMLLEFGVSIEIGDDYLLIGAGRSANKPSASGSVYVFTNRNGAYFEEALIQSPDNDADDLFASCLEVVSGTQFLVGAPRASGQADNSGAIFSYVKNDQGWILNQKITSPQEVSDGLFGCSVSYADRRMLVGAMQERSDTIISGAAYTYRLDEFNHFVLDKRLVPEDASDHDYFGFSVSLQPAYAMIASPKYEVNRKNNDMGCVDLFDVSDLDRGIIAKILPQDGAGDDHFGMSISSDPASLFIGSRLSDNRAINDGAGYFYSLPQVVGVPQELLADQSSPFLKLWPNPFNNETTLFFQIYQQSHVKVMIYDVQGRLVNVLLDKELVIGTCQVNWNGTDLQNQNMPAGVYTVIIQTNNETLHVKLVKAG
jgi:hypothetical protein